MSYIVLRVRWCNIIVLNAPTEDKTDDIKDRFYEELEQVFDKFILEAPYENFVRRFQCQSR
jgi:hypothetical protein